MSQDLFSDSQLFASQDVDLEANGASDHSEREDEEDNGEGQSSPVGKGSNGRSKPTLVKTDLSEEMIAKHKKEFVDIGVKTRDAENIADICRSTRVLADNLQRQDQAFRTGGCNENMPLDAKCIQTNSAISLQLVKKLQTDSKRFHFLEFAEKLLTALDPIHRMDENSDPNDSQPFDANDWVEFGRTYCRFQRLVPTFDFIHGSFDATPNEAQPKQPKPRVRHQKPDLSAQTGATQIDPNCKVSEDATPEEVDLIMQTIKKLERKNSSLPYIEVIVNPKSISETVENVFHSTFLVKDGLARLASDEDGGPAIQSVDNSQVEASQDDRGLQSIFSFSMKDWKYWINKFEIRKAAIRHAKKKTADN